MIPRPRTPKALARITGADRLHPGRFKHRSEPQTTLLGKPSAWMNDIQKRAWAAFQREVPWLAESDRVLVEIAVTIRARLMAGEIVGASALNQLRLCIGQMGATPADKSKITPPDQTDEDATDRFFC